MAKKTFKDQINPAMNFISPKEEDQPKAPTPQKAPKGYKVNPLYIETKSIRLQLLIQPSLKEKLIKEAKKEGRSVNDLVNSILQDALKGE